MSQIYKSAASGPVPPTVPTSFVTDVNSPAIPAANILNEVGGFTSNNNANGIQTDGSSGGNTLTVQLTNRIAGTVSTSGNVTSTIITFALPATPGVYFFNTDIVAFCSSVPSGAGFSTYTTIQTDGVTATVIDDTDAITHKSISLAFTNAFMDVSGNNALVKVTGANLLNINWNAVGTYIRVF